MSEKPKEVHIPPQLATVIWRHLYASGNIDIADLLAARMIHDDVGLRQTIAYLQKRYYYFGELI